MPTRRITGETMILLMIIFLLTPLAFAGDGSRIYWVSPNGTSTWSNCESATPLSGNAACGRNTAQTNASAGDTVYFRAGTYTGPFNPSNSGTSWNNQIIFAAYQNESVVFSINTTAFTIDLNGNDYVKLDGFDVTGQRWLTVRNTATNNEITNCSFRDSTNPSIGFPAIRIWENAKYNWFHNNTVYGSGQISSCNDIGALLWIGNWSNSSDRSYYNLIENSTFYHGGHDNVTISSPYNVLRNNYLYNDAWLDASGCPNRSGLVGGRNLNIDATHNQDNLIEGNRFGYAGIPVDDNGAFGIEVVSKKNVIRYNLFYKNGAAGIYFTRKWYSTTTADNMVYNNTIYYNGYDPEDNDLYDSGIQFGTNGYGQPTGNVFKNNIVYDNDGGAYGCTGSNCSGYTANNSFSNNWETSNGDPYFLNTAMTDPTDNTKPDLNLQSSSGAIDGGTHLTSVTSASGSGLTFTVGDARYFQDISSWGLPSRWNVNSDVLLIGSSVAAADRVQISSISGNSITVTAPFTWSNGDKVWIYKKSDGERVLYGSAPDYGAKERSSAPGGPNAPQNLRVVLSSY